jgi:hypothetical protein
LNPRRYQHAATAGAVTLTACALTEAVLGLHLYAALFSVGAALCAEAALRERRHQDRRRAEAVRAELAARPDCPEPPPLVPCCLLAEATGGAVHHHRCTRPGSSRR